jgi:septum formation protein
MNRKRPKLILASRSPRRRELLTEAGYEIEIVPPHESAECGMCSRESPEQLVARLARQKAADVVERHPYLFERTAAGLVVACDTVAECDGQILGKPANEDNARRMLQLLSGREHRVLSGLCLWSRPAGTQVPRQGAGSRDCPSDSLLRAPCSVLCRVAITRLRMDRLAATDLDEYLASGLWEGKAGAFGYQDRLGWVHVEEGSETNVVGLPMELLAEMLREMKYDE